MIDENMLALLKKKAEGYYYKEESAEYEAVGGQKFMFCKKKGRLYYNNGYLKVKLIREFSSSKKIELVQISKFVTLKYETCFRLK